MKEELATKDFGHQWTVRSTAGVRGAEITDNAKVSGLMGSLDAALVPTVVELGDGGPGWSLGLDEAMKVEPVVRAVSFVGGACRAGFQSLHLHRQGEAMQDRARRQPSATQGRSPAQTPSLPAPPPLTAHLQNHGKSTPAVQAAQPVAFWADQGKLGST